MTPEAKTNYENNKKSLNQLNEKYTFGENGRVYKKGVKASKGVSNSVTGEEAENAKKQYAELNKEVQNYENAESNYEKASKKKWDNINSGISQAGQALTGLGVGLSMVGGLFGTLGLDGVNEAFALFGNVLMIAGTAISILLPIFSLFSIKVQGESKKLVIAGIQTQLAWWWIFIIIGALIVIIALIAIIISQVKKNSAKGKLEAASKAADEAAEAADNAAEAFKNLGDSLDSLGDKYKGLEELTKGTKEWNDAVSDINNNVMELMN
jgi:uncharacterized membrane protein YcjF (UPF0283 family)